MEIYQDPITGYEVRRYTTGPERNAKLYFTCENFSTDDRYFFFMKQELTDAKKELSGGYKKTTNNRMELMGVIAALECLRFPCEADIYSDSKYVVSAFNEKWIDSWQKNGWKTASKQPVKNKELWERLLAAAAPHTIRFHWVKGHAGNPENERCDALAVAAGSGKDLPADLGYEKKM